MLALLLYALTIAVVYSPVVFMGKSLEPALYQPHGVVAQGVYKQRGRRPVASFNVDIATPAYYEHPVNKLVGDLYRQGALPLWNPYQAGGTPLAAQYSTRVFFPYQIIEDLSPAVYWDYFTLGRLLFAGFFTYLFLDALGLAFETAFAGGLFYMLSGVFAWFISLEQFTNAAMMVPALLYSVEKLASAVSAGIYAARRNIVITGIMIALVIYAGQPEVALYVFLLAALFYLVRVLSLRGSRGSVRAAAAFALSFAAGLALSAPLVFVFLELVSQSYHIHPLGGYIGMQKLSNWKGIFAYFTPSVTEFPTDAATPLVGEIMGDYYRFLPLNGVWDTLGGFTGIIPPFLTLAGLVYLTASRGFSLKWVFLFFVSFDVTIALKNIGIWPFVLLGHLPLFDMAWSLRWAGPAKVFSLVSASAIAFELIRTQRFSHVTLVTDALSSGTVNSGLGRYFRMKPYMAATIPFILVLGVYLLVPFVPAVSLYLHRDEFFNARMSPFVLPSVLFGSFVTISVLLLAFLIIVTSFRRPGKMLYSLTALGALELWWAVPRGYDAAWLMYKWMPFSVGLLTVLLLYMERWRPAAVSALIFFTVFTAVDTVSPHGYPQRQDPFRHAPYVDFLKGRLGDYRAAGVGGALFPNYSGALGIKDIRYVNSLVPSAYHEFRRDYLHIFSITEGTDSALWFTGRPERSALAGSPSGGRYLPYSSPVEDDIIKKLRNYSFLGVRYFIIPGRDFPGNTQTLFDTATGTEGRKFQLIYDKEVRIYENPDVLPRAFVVYDYSYAASSEKAAEAAFGGSRFDLARKAVLEDAPPSGGAGGVPGAKDGSYTATITEYKPNRAVIDAQTGRDGVLVLTDVYYPGWRVTVNGAEGKVVRVNGVVRGVRIKAGANHVEFSYSPLSFRAGAAVFLLTGLLSAFILTQGAFRKKPVAHGTGTRIQ